MLAFLDIDGTMSDEAALQLEEETLRAAGLDLDSLILSIFDSGLPGALADESRRNIVQGMLAGESPEEITTKDAVSTYVSGFCKALQWIEWLKTKNEKELIK